MPWIESLGHPQPFVVVVLHQGDIRTLCVVTATWMVGPGSGYASGHALSLYCIYPGQAVNLMGALQYRRGNARCTVALSQVTFC